jgi:hypothetical protein
MEHGATLRLAVSRLTRLVRQRRALYYGVRGLLWGLCAAVLPVALRSVAAAWALPAAAGLAVGGALIGVVYGLLLRVPAADVLGLADRAFGLHDRLATAFDLLRREVRGPLVTAAIADAERRVPALALARAVPWRWPREVRLLPAPVLVLAALPYLPPIPVPDVHLPAVRSADEEEKKAQQAGPAQAIERPTPRRSERVERVDMQEREYAVRPNPESREHAKGDLAAAFKDTNVATKRPDFSSFLKQGDERIRMLERVESLPDLQRDFTQSQYKVLFRKSRSLLAGMDPRQLSPERLRQLLEEMGRMGRRGQSGGSGEGDWGQELMEGAEALDQGQMSRALDAMERALQKMRAMEDRQRGGRELKGGRESGRRGGRDGQRGGEGQPGADEPDFGEGHGSLPGRGTNPGWRGDPTTRLGQDPLDVGVEGQMRRGRREAYDTNMVGRGTQNPSRLPSMSVVTQYRKMMEEALAKEAIPLDYRSQVKDYFQALEER